MKIGGFEPDCKRVHLKKCLKKVPALNLKICSNGHQPAAGRYYGIFAIFPSTRIGAIRRNIVKIDENLNLDKMQLRYHLWLNLKHESKGGERGREKRRGSFTG